MEPAAKRRKRDDDDDDQEEEEDDVIEHSSVPQKEVDIGSIKERLARKKAPKAVKEKKTFATESVADEELVRNSKLLPVYTKDTQ